MSNGGWSLEYVDATQCLAYNYKAMGDHEIPIKWYEECKSVLKSISSAYDSEQRQKWVASADSRHHGQGCFEDAIPQVPLVERQKVEVKVLSNLAPLHRSLGRLSEAEVNYLLVLDILRMPAGLQDIPSL